MGESVLIIDAEDAFVDDLASGLRAKGIEATVTGDGSAGLDLAHINIPSAIVLCVELPKMSGYSVCTKLKKDAALKSVPLIMTSADATQEMFDHHKRLKTRAEEYLKKPFTTDDLVHILGNYLEFEPPAPAEELPVVPVMDEPDEDVADQTYAGAGEPPPEDFAAIDNALDALSDEVEPPSFDLSEQAALRAEPSSGEDAMTTVAPVAMQDEHIVQALNALKADLEKERQARSEAEEARDTALANEKAALAQAKAASSSQPPSGGTAASGRDLLALKRELNAKNRDILDLKEKLNAKEKDILVREEREMELEGQIVEAEEQREVLERNQAELEERTRNAESQTQETERSMGETIEKLNRRLGEAVAHEAELDGALQSITQESENLRTALDAKTLEFEELTEHAQTLKNELSASTAESESLRGQLDGAQEHVENLNLDVSNLQDEIATAKAEVESLTMQLGRAQDRGNEALKRIRETAEIKAKARKAMEIALALLEDAAQLPGPDAESISDGESQGEARP